MATAAVISSKIDDSSSRKLTSDSNCQLFSPPSSEFGHSAKYYRTPSKTPKKRRLNNSNPNNSIDPKNDIDPTPRQPVYAKSQASYAISNGVSLSSTEDSITSGQSSTKKVFSALSINPEGLDLRTLDIDDPTMPASLTDLLVDFEKIARGKNVVPLRFKVIDIHGRTWQRANSSSHRTENEIMALRQSIRSFAAFEPDVFSDETNLSDPTQQLPLPASDHFPSLGGPEFTLHDILSTLNDAKECPSLDYDEAGWNSLVHTPLLHLAHHGHGFRGHQLDGFSPW